MQATICPKPRRPIVKKLTRFDNADASQHRKRRAAELGDLVVSEILVLIGANQLTLVWTKTRRLSPQSPLALSY